MSTARTQLAGHHGSTSPCSHIPIATSMSCTAASRLHRLRPPPSAPRSAVSEQRSLGSRSLLPASGAQRGPNPVVMETPAAPCDAGLTTSGRPLALRSKDLRKDIAPRRPPVSHGPLTSKSVSEAGRRRRKELLLPPLQHTTKCIFCQNQSVICLLYTSPSPRDGLLSRMPSSA